MDCSVRLARALLGLAVAAWAGQPQAPPPVITATTRLVQVSVIAKEKGAVLRVIPVTDRGEIMLEPYQSLLGARTKIVALTHASNSLGTILPVAEMTALAKRYDLRDAVFLAGSPTEPLSVVRLDLAQPVHHGAGAGAGAATGACSAGACWAASITAAPG